MPSSAEDIAKASVAALWQGDAASQRLGMSIDKVGPGFATLTFTITPEMLNGHGTCHGGYIFMLADSAFAFAANSYSEASVAQHCSITYLTPARADDRLKANAIEVSRRGRSGVYDVEVTNQDGVQVALFRGHSRVVQDQRSTPAS